MVLSGFMADIVGKNGQSSKVSKHPSTHSTKNVQGRRLWVGFFYRFNLIIAL